MRDAIPPGERLAVTLRYLATGQLSITDYYYLTNSNTCFCRRKF